MHVPVHEWISPLAGACLQHSGGAPASGAPPGEAAAPGTTDPPNHPRPPPANPSPCQHVGSLAIYEQFRSADPAVHFASDFALMISGTVKLATSGTLVASGKHNKHPPWFTMFPNSHNVQHFRIQSPEKGMLVLSGCESSAGDSSTLLPTASHSSPMHALRATNTEGV